MPRLDNLLNLIFANRCVSCGELGASACNSCWQNLQLRPRPVLRTSSNGKTLAGMAASDFDQSSGRLIHAYKDAARSSLAKQFAAAMVPLLPQLLASATVQPEVVTLVGAPSQVGSIQQRGFSPGALIAKSLANQATSSLGATRFELGNHLVWRIGDSADQATLSAEQRRTNLAGTMRASNGARQKLFVLVDDIVTTGSTFFELATTLEAAGGRVLGFVTFSETILRNIQKKPTQLSKRV